MGTHNVVFERFNSIDRLIKANDNRHLNSAFKSKPILKSIDIDPSTTKFTQTKSYEEAVNLLENGWDKHLDTFKTENKLNANTVIQKKRPTLSVVGYVPNVPNAIMGLPNSMITTEIVKQKIKAVTIIYSSCASYRWTAEELVQCGISVMKIINVLESQGIRVKLIVEGISSTTVNKNWSLMWVDVKDWREPLDLKKISFPVIHPSMLRRIAFRWLETNPNITDSKFKNGYGNVIEGGDYFDTVVALKTHGLLKDNEYYITPSFCKRNNFNSDRIMESLGLEKNKRKGA